MSKTAILDYYLGKSVGFYPILAGFFIKKVSFQQNSIHVSRVITPRKHLSFVFSLDYLYLVSQFCSSEKKWKHFCGKHLINCFAI